MTGNKSLTSVLPNTVGAIDVRENPVHDVKLGCVACDASGMRGLLGFVGLGMVSFSCKASQG